MSVSLLNPFHIAHPTAVQTFFVAGAHFARFDPSGRFVAAGRYDGLLAVFDLIVKEPVRVYEAHVKALTSVSWSRNSRFVLSSSKDWNVTVWDLAAVDDPSLPWATLRFDAPVASASFHPRNCQIILALLSTGEAYVVDLRKEHRSRVELCEILPEPSPGEDPARTRPAAMTAAAFDPSGRHIFVGMSNATILVFNTRTKIMVARHRVSGAGVFKSLSLSSLSPSHDRLRLVSNSSDRVLRLFTIYPAVYPRPTLSPLPGARRAHDPDDPDADVDADGEVDDDADGHALVDYLEDDLEPLQRFQDPITRTAWASASLSGSSAPGGGGGLLAGGAADPSGHKIYIWDIANDGRFVSTLDGGREPLVDVHWHPRQPRIVSTTKQGNVLVWHAPAPERWGAFAGGFEEVDENVLYEEKEDEFDIQDEDELARRKAAEEDEVVDIEGFDDDDGADAGLRTDGLWEEDEDVRWAEDEPDEDTGEWTLKVWMEDDEQY